MSLKENILSRVISVIFPVVIIIIIFIMINAVNERINDLRDQEAYNSLNLVSIAISAPYVNGEFPKCTFDIVDHINSIENQSIFIKNSNMEVVIPDGGISQFCFEEVHPNLGRMIDEYNYGTIAKYVNSGREYVYFRWLYSKCGKYPYLVLYSIHQDSFNFSFIYIFAYIAIILVAIYAVKTIFFDHMIYMSILARTQTSSIKNFSYRTYDD